MLKCQICGSHNTVFFHKINNFNYYCCKNCTTLFLSPKPVREKVKKYYRNSFQYTAGETNEQSIRIRAKIILKKLNSINPKGKTLLDIGSGYGYFLSEALNSGIKATGIEPSKALFSYSVKKFRLSKIYNLEFSDFYTKFKTKKYDFIVLSHVIEHLDNPGNTIKKCLDLLKTGGALYIETPNLDSHLYRAEKKTYTFLTPPDHIWLFSKNSFRYMLRKYDGAKIEKISSYSKPEHLMGILKILLHRSANAERSTINPYKNKISAAKISRNNFKYLIFDKFLAHIFTPVLNVGVYGSILELYIRKK